MARYLAFLRAINVGGRVVKMEALRSVFEEMKLQNVATYIASGNVIFETRQMKTDALESRIERALQEALGFEVATMVRTEAEVALAAEYEPFQRSAVEAARAFHVGFMTTTLDREACKAVEGLSSEVDSFHVHGREVYWLCATGVGESKFSNVRFEKLTGTKVTFRSIKTVRKLAALYPPA